MEQYRGIKFSCQHIDKCFESDERLLELHRWVVLQSQLGLAPVHKDGAFGNHSYRVDGERFVVTRTGMIPVEDMQQEDYCQIVSCENGVFSVMGCHQPSSESFLHLYIYQTFPGTGAIMHGHSSLMNIHGDALDIPTTEKAYPYGTEELALSAREILSEKTPFILLKDHGYVAMGGDIASTGRLVLHHYERLVKFIGRNYC